MREVRCPNCRDEDGKAPLMLVSTQTHGEVDGTRYVREVHTCLLCSTFSIGRKLRKLL